MDYNNSINRIYFFAKNQAKNLMILNDLLQKKVEENLSYTFLVENLFCLCEFLSCKKPLAKGFQ